MEFEITQELQGEGIVKSKYPRKYWHGWEKALCFDDFLERYHEKTPILCASNAWGSWHHLRPDLLPGSSSETQEPQALEDNPRRSPRTSASMPWV